MGVFMHFKERLKQLRKEKNLKQEEVARFLNISTSAYGYYEQGKNIPSVPMLENLSTYFEVTMDYLIGRCNWNFYGLTEEEYEELQKYQEYLLYKRNTQ